MNSIVTAPETQAVSARRTAPAASKPPAARSSAPRLAPALLLALMAVLLAGSAWRESVTVDEVDYIGAGVSYFQKLDLRLNPEQPPLSKLVAALPVVLKGARADYSSPAWIFSGSPGFADLAQWVFGDWVVNRWNRPQETLLLARVPMLLGTLALGWLIYAGALRLGGPWGALLCLAVYVSTPLFLAFGPLVLSDVLVALFSVLALWQFASLWETPSRDHALKFGLSLAAALLSKFNSGILFFAIPAFVLSTYWRSVSGPPADAERARAWRKSRWRAAAEGLACAAALVYAVYLVFSWNQPAGDAAAPPTGVAALWARLVMPPAIYWKGLATIFTSASRPTFVFGHSYPRGVWFYFPALFALKSPVGFLGLLILAAALATAVRGRGSRERAGETPIVSRDAAAHWRMAWISATVFSAVCFASHLDISFRYFATPVALLILLLAPLPALLRRLGESAPRAARLLTATAAILVCSCVASALWAYPYYIPYVNALAGGRPAYQLFNDSNVDWNQALPEVGRFAASHGLGEIAVDWYGFTDAAFVVPQARFWNCQRPAESDQGQWVAVSANMILDAHNCEWLMQYPHEALGGGSMYAVHLPERIPPPGTSGGPPAPDAYREILGLHGDVRPLLLALERDPRNFARLTVSRVQ